jgi:hypothetical protein
VRWDERGLVRCVSTLCDQLMSCDGRVILILVDRVSAQSPQSHPLLLLYLSFLFSECAAAAPRYHRHPLLSSSRLVSLVLSFQFS